MSQDKIKIEFVPGCFDDFEGTQEELDEFVAEIRRMADTGLLFELSEPTSNNSWDLLPEAAKAEITRDQTTDGKPNTRH